MKNTGELPENHLKMPPPYWRSSGAIFQVLDALDDLLKHLGKLLEIHPIVESKIDEYLVNNPEGKEDDLEFARISAPLDLIEHKIKMKCELAVFMTAIHVEDRLNLVIVYNLDKDIGETIEKLSPSEKLQILAASLKQESVKSKKPYEGVKNLTTWRNAYAHGHCTDRPTKSLRHNHLIKPDYYPSVPKEIEFLINRLEDYLTISKYLKFISINDYTKSDSVEDNEIKFVLNELKTYKFDYQNEGNIYIVYKDW